MDQSVWTGYAMQKQVKNCQGEMRVGDINEQEQSDGSRMIQGWSDSSVSKMQ